MNGAEEGKKLFLAYVEAGEFIVPEELYNEIKNYEVGASYERDTALARFVMNCKNGELLPPGVNPKGWDKNILLPRRPPHGENVHLLRIYSEPVKKEFSRESPDPLFSGRE